MNYWKVYRAAIRRNCLGNYTQGDGLLYWQNRLFATIITYWIPVSFLALVPGVIMSFVGGIPSLGIIDILAASAVIVITFSSRLSIHLRKLLFICLLYILALVLIYYLGTSGPGLVYLLGVTIFIILIFPAKFGYFSVLINIIICGLTFVGIRFQLLHSTTAPFSSFGSWLAVSANLILLSLIFSILLPKLFNGLNTTIERLQNLDNKLKIQQLIVEGSEKRFRMLVENTGDIIASFDAEAKFTYASPAFERITGYSAETLTGQSFAMLMNEKQRQSAMQFLVEVRARHGVSFPTVFSIFHKNGHKVWIEGTVTNFLNEEGIHAIIGNYRDITQKKKDEQKLIRANRMYAFISAINQAVVHTSDRETLFTKVCDIAVHVGQFKMVWLSVIDKEQQTIHLAGQGGIPDTDLKLFDSVSLADDNPTTYVLKENTYYLSNDIQNDDNNTICKTYAAMHGINSCMWLPIRQNNDIVAILHLLSIERRFFDETEIRLLEEVAGDISFALSVFDKERLRREEEERRKKSELRLIEAQTLAKVGSWEVDLINHTETWSDELYKICEIDKNKVRISREIFLSLCHPDDRAFVTSRVEYANTTFEDISFDFRLLIKDDKIKYVYLELRFELDKDKKLSRIYGIVQDITEKKLVEEKNRMSEIRYQALFEQAPDAISITDTDGNFIEVNTSMCNLLGYTKAEFQLLKIRDFIFEEDMKLDPPRVQYLNPGEDVRYERRLKRKNGTAVYVDLSGGTMDNGQHLAFIRDITEKKMAEYQKEFDTKNFHALINSTDDLMWSVDKNMTLITCNKAFQHLIEQVTGKSLSDGSNIIKAGFNKEQLERYNAFFERALAGETFKTIDHLPAPFNIWSEISFYPIVQGNEIVGSACYSRDITTMKLAEQERIKMTNDIIQRNKNLEQFPYIVSHNLRAPVANISGIVYVLQTIKLDKEQEKRVVSELSKSVNKLDEVIVDLNHILLRKDGSQFQEKEKVYFSEMVENVQLSISNMIAKEQFEIVSDFSAINEFMTTRSYLYSIFYNLISNSIKYRRTDTSSFIKIISALSENSIILTFEDNGLGIDLEKKGDQVFGLYKRFHNHTEGKGMGLYMVKTHVESLGGQIEIESAVNHGTTFTIQFERDK